MLRTKGFTLAFIIWMVLLTTLSLIDLSGLAESGIEIPMGDKLMHFTWYFVAALLGMLLLREQTMGWFSLWYSALVIFSFLTIYGTILEVIQVVLTAVRSGDINDALANGAGALAGVLLIAGLFSLKQTADWKI